MDERERAVFVDRESTGPATQAGMVSPVATSMLAAGVTRSLLALLRGWRRVRGRG